MLLCMSKSREIVQWCWIIAMFQCRHDLQVFVDFTASQATLCQCVNFVLGLSGGTGMHPCLGHSSMWVIGWRWQTWIPCTIWLPVPSPVMTKGGETGFWWARGTRLFTLLRMSLTKATNLLAWWWATYQSLPMATSYSSPVVVVV